VINVFIQQAKEKSLFNSNCVYYHYKKIHQKLNLHIEKDNFLKFDLLGIK